MSGWGRGGGSEKEVIAAAKIQKVVAESRPTNGRSAAADYRLPNNICKITSRAGEYVTMIITCIAYNASDRLSLLRNRFVKVLV